MTFDAAAARAAVTRVAARFGEPARATILFENIEKHVEELLLIQAAARTAEAAVIDIGGGVGVNLLVLRELGWAGPLALVDKLTEYTDGNRMGDSGRAIELLRAATVTVHQLSIWPDCTIPCADGVFDVATTFDVIEHLPGHPLRQLTEMRRVLRPGGRCIVGAPNATSLMKRVHLARGRHPYIPFDEWVSPEYIYHYREYTPDEYRKLLETAGYHSIRMVLSHAIPRARARYSYHRGRHHPLSPVAIALHINALIEAAVPPLRHSVYCVAEPAVESGSVTRAGAG